MKIYEVIINCNWDIDSRSVKTILFTDRKFAIDCVKQLYDTKFNEGIESPFASLENMEQVKVRKVSEKIDGEMKIISFEINNVAYYEQNISVSINEKNVDEPSSEWTY